MKVTPIGERIAVEPIVPAETKALASGLIVETKHDTFRRGKVVAVPKGYDAVKVGQTAIYGQHYEITVDGETATFVDVAQVIAVVG